MTNISITAISDLHGHYPKLEGGDLLIVAGDLTTRDLPCERLEFLEWLAYQDYKRKIFIAGNHDNSLVNQSFKKTREDAVDYLCDSGTQYEGLKIWGSPWTLRFPGMNPSCMAFTCETEEHLAEKWAMIPDDVDILITHSPIAGFLDRVEDYLNGKILNVGSTSLKQRIWSMENPPKLIVCGHIHEGYGKTFDTWYEFSNDEFEMIIVNASHVNERYRPVNKPIRIEL